MRRRTAVVLVATLTILLLIPALVWATHDKPAWLTEVFEGPKYDVYYTTNCPSDEPDCADNNEEIPDTDSDGNSVPDLVDQISGYLEDSHSVYTGTFGMEEPKFSGTSDRPAYMTGGCWGQYNGHRMRMCPSTRLTSDWVQAKATAVHELFHAVQAAYGVGQPAWITEGQAALVEDEVFDDLDDNAGTFLFSRGEAYLRDPNTKALTGASYAVAWFWKYFVEQYGSLGDPGQGMDAIRTFWEEAQDTGTSGIEAVNRTLDTEAPGTTFEDVFKEFVIANYARKLSGSSIPAKYTFADEAEPSPGPLRAVKLDVDTALAVDEQVGPLTADVRAWGARYYEIRPASDVPLLSFEVRQDTSARTSSDIYYVLLGIKSGDIVLEERTVAINYNRALVNDAYDRVVLIVAGLEHYANYRLNINGSDPVLDITNPLGVAGGTDPVRPAFVGDPSDPDKFLLKVDVLDPDGDPIPGLDPTTFTITVGSKIVPDARILTPNYIQGQYWMLVRPPTQSSAGRYDLTVAWSTLSDVEAQAIDYTPRPDADNIIVLDRSGSMGSLGKLTAAQNAGRLYVDSWRDGEQIGVVGFNQNAGPVMDLTDLDSSSRGNAKTFIDSLTALGDTAIGDGLLEALENQLDPRGEAGHKWALVVLSDGIETDDKRVSDFLSVYKNRKDNGDRVPVVHTVALGADADRGKMQDLANRTDGTYQYAAEPSSTSTTSTSAATAVNLPLDLAEIYRIVGEEVANQQQIFNQRVTLGPNPPTATVDIPVDAGTEAVFTLNWEDGKNGANVTLTDPDGNPVSRAYTDDTHYVWREPDPSSGPWKLHIDCLPVSSCATTYLVEVGLKSPITFDVFFDPAPADRVQGMPVDILAPLTDHKAILGATVDADVTRPDGSVVTMTLYDDGSHHDGNADDGLYGNRFFRTFDPGSYVVKASAAGTSNLGPAFARYATRAFDLVPDQDSDNDKLPDTWEKEHGTDPNTPDGQQDPDLDGLITFDEYYNGTDPHDPDTDDGGENDGSEVQANHDPHDPGDDSIPATTGELYLTPWDGANILTFPVLPQWHSYFRLYRTTDPDQGYQLINPQVPPTGAYTDTQVSNGTTYWYRLVAVSPQGSQSAPSNPVAGTPKTDPVAPGGFVLINDGDDTTRSRTVQLDIGGSDDEPAHVPSPQPMVEASDTPPTEMRISNDPSFAGATWQPYATSKTWQLDETSGPAVVYVQFRDDAGNTSEVASDAIMVDVKRIFLPLIVR